MEVKMTYNDEVISLNEHFINEPINKLIENLRVQNFNLVDYSDLEIILNFYDLNLKLNEVSLCFITCLAVLFISLTFRITFTLTMSVYLICSKSIQI